VSGRRRLAHLAYNRVMPRFALLTLVCLSACLSCLTPAAAGAQAAERQLSINFKSAAWRGDLNGMIERRTIRVLVPYSKTMYFVDFGGTQRGLCYDFMHAFEDQLNQKLERGNLRIQAVFIPVSREALLPILEAGEGDVVAANLTITPERLKKVDFTTPLASGVKEVIVTGPGAAPLSSLQDLSGREVYVQPASSYHESLTALNARFAQNHARPVALHAAPGNFESEDILEMANAGLVRVVVADNYLARFWKDVYPNLTVREDLVLRESGDIAFAIRKNSPQLKQALDEFARAHRAGTLFGNVELKKYLKETRWAKNAVTQAELEKFNTLVVLFQKYGRQYDIDWLLMAAQGYQESQLDQSRHSSAGAVGVMQLTAATGRDMNVGDITQLDPNIHAGIKYVRFMVDTYFKNEPMDELNKVLFAFASYNAGPNRIRELRHEAASRKLNPNVWFDNVERIASERIGRETVQYVSNIYKYYIAYTLVQEQVEKNLKAAHRDARH
jgi:membrane-bound lytic murein transglycosylase MltF